MATCRETPLRLGRSALAALLAVALSLEPLPAQTKPTGAPLVLSSIETEQEVPLAILLPDGKTAKCVSIRLHWTSQPSVKRSDEATSFSLDLPANNSAAPVFTAQLWNASLASALAWQQPWEGARWKIIQTPVTDGTGIDAALAVGMIATSARRPYPPKTVVIGSLNPDGSLGPVSHMIARLDAAAMAGMSRVIIPSVQRFDADSDGQVVDILKHAGGLHLECVPVDDLVSATEVTMNDPLPDTTMDASIPKYSNDVTSYIDDFAHHEQGEAANGLKYAPTEAQLATYPAHLAAIWKTIYADNDAAGQAYRAGQVYTAYYLFCRANGRMNGANALAGQTRETFDVKSALAESSDLHDHLDALMSPPAIDKGELQSAVVVAEMADWAFEIKAALEGAQLVAKQAFSQRSDATPAEKDRAREAILFANEQCKYLLTQVVFYNGLADHIAQGTPLPVDENASHLLPQLIPAQLATARHFTDGIRASDLRDGLLFDPRLVAYVNVLRQVKADWDARQRKREIDAQAEAEATAEAQATAAVKGSTNAPSATPVKLDSNSVDGAVGFDPGDTYRPPHTIVATADNAKKLSDVALCLIWVNHDCEIATLDQKYLRLAGTMDPATHEWHVKDRPKLDNLIRMADIGARRGIAFAEKAQVDPSVLAMIYERASAQRDQSDDNAALDALRNYWRCALLGNMCWQLAHTPKAQPVDASAAPIAADSKKSDGSKSDTAKSDSAKSDSSKSGPKKSETAQGDASKSSPPAASTNTVVVVDPHNADVTTNTVVTPVSPASGPVVLPPVANAEVPSSPAPAPVQNQPEIPVAPIASRDEVVVDPPANPGPVRDDAAPVNPVPPPSAPPAPVNADASVPVAPVAPNDDSAPPAPRAQPVDAPPAPETAVNPPAPVPPPAPAPAPASPTPPSAPTTAASDGDANVPVAPIAKAEDYSGNPPALSNAAPVAPVAPAALPIVPSSKPSDSADHSL